MEIDTLQEWLFVTFYYVAQVIFVLSGVILAKKTKKASAYLCAAGFAAFLIGNIVMIDASKKLVEIEQTQGETVSVREYESIGRMLSSIGFLVAGASMLLFVVRKQEG